MQVSLHNAPVTDDKLTFVADIPPMGTQMMAGMAGMAVVGVVAAVAIPAFMGYLHKAPMPGK